ncbi:MAG TPA: prepilin-type N-terminal cleavage/methylation domain-containing protein [Thermodesulfovibrionales bacterium]|nr:prepilin-type N-terminal cleavage/methylation domain-containing protein [Thermodesulfovibrionales bacterium]
MLNKKGMTLIEVMVALVVLLLVALAMMQTALLSIDSNMISALRDQALKLAETRMNNAKGTTFSKLSSGSQTDTGALDPGICSATLRAKMQGVMGAIGSANNGQVVTASVRSMPSFNYCTNVTAQNLNPNNVIINVTVGWTWQGQDYVHNIGTIVGNL